MKKRFLPLILCFFCNLLLAQDKNIQYRDQTYVDNIHSVQFHQKAWTIAVEDDLTSINTIADFEELLNTASSRQGNIDNGLDRITAQMTQPIVTLGSNTGLFFSFDDFSEETSNYVYTIELCNADWTPSGMSPLEYIDGFMEGDIEEFDFSYNTYQPYINYNLVLPNEEVRWTKSGNYLLKVYNNDYDEKQLVITRRFMVVERERQVFFDFDFLSSTSKFSTHQELNFEIHHKNFPIDQPNREITVVLMQNHRWDNAIYVKEPRYNRNNVIYYTLRNQYLFGAGKEFRFLDTRSFQARRHKVLEINNNGEFFELTLFPEEPRYDRSYLREPDMNGLYVIETTDQNGNDYLRADYSEVLFTLKMGQELEDEDVYIAGNFTNWAPDEKYRMTYNHLINAYVAKLDLKQGVYEYFYATAPKDNPQRVDVAAIEGDWYETENDYTILVYYRPFGGRYDQLIGYGEYNTIDQNRINNR